MTGAKGFEAVVVTEEEADVGTEMMDGAAYVEDGKAGRGAEDATGESSTGDWMVVEMVWEL